MAEGAFTPYGRAIAVNVCDAPMQESISSSACGYRAREEEPRTINYSDRVPATCRLWTALEQYDTPLHLVYGRIFVKVLDYCDERHLQAAKRVLKYLAQTRSMGVVYFRSDEAGLHAYTNSDFATNKEGRKSASRFVFKFASETVRW